MPNDQNEPAKKGPPIEEPSVSDLTRASEELKAKIAEAKARSDMPIDSTLGNPNWDKSAADGHLDVPDVSFRRHSARGRNADQHDNAVSYLSSAGVKFLIRFTLAR
jgi:hypothetical protein